MPAGEATGISDPKVTPRLASGSPNHTALGQRLAEPRPHSREDAEAAYVFARDAWTGAMRAANSGRAADMASLAIAQEAYEAAAAERDRWSASTRVAIPVEPAESRSDLDAVVGQSLEWRKVHEQEPAAGGLIGLIRRIFGG